MSLADARGALTSTTNRLSTVSRQHSANCSDTGAIRSRPSTKLWRTIQFVTGHIFPRDGGGHDVGEERAAGHNKALARLQELGGRANDRERS